MALVNSNIKVAGPFGSSSLGSNSSSGGSEQSSNSFTGISNPEALLSLMNYIKNASAGGSESYKSQIAERQKQLQNVTNMVGNFTPESAFQDAQLLMQENLRKSMEANMPAISKAITGSGTSASSMQGLLSQKFATESAQAAGALGAEQARSYGGISAQLAGVLEALSRVNTSGEDNLLKALDLAKTATSQSQGTTTNASSGSSSGNSLRAPSISNPYMSYSPQRYTAGSSSPAAPVNNNWGGISNSYAGNDTQAGPSGNVNYQYIPYDLANPGFVNPFSSNANQGAAMDYNSNPDYYDENYNQGSGQNYWGD